MKEVLYGRNPVYECLRAGRRQIHQLTLASGAQEKGTLADVIALAKQRGLTIRHVDRRQLDTWAGTTHHQGVALEASAYPYATLDDILSLAARRDEPPWLLLLDLLQDPQNLGTLLRTAEAVGVHGVVIPEHKAAQITPAVVSSSSGASEHLLIAQVTNMARTMSGLKEHDIWISGLEDVPEAQILWQSNLRGALALVVGSEGQGMRRLVRETCDLLLRLPMQGQVSSLNAAVAGSVALYEIARQRWNAAEAKAPGTVIASEAKQSPPA